MSETTGGAHYGEYLRRVDEAMLAAGGVPYTELTDMAAEMDRGQRVVQLAAARGLDPAAFAAIFIKMHNLAHVDAKGPVYASEFNRRRAAIACFASTPAEPGDEHGDWSMCSDGRAYRDTQDGRLLRLEVANRGDHWGFVVSVSSSPAALAAASDDPFRRMSPPPPGMAFERLASGSDIGDVVSRAFCMTAAPQPGPAA